MFTIDGSMGEGGGQIFRTALALSLLKGVPVRITNIRAGRPKPGLMRQHLTALQAAIRVSEGHADGALVGSTEVTFRPGSVQGGEHSFSVGTAGSTTLVLQTLLPALLSAATPSTLVLEGGTHNPHAPPFDHLSEAFLPILRRMGAKVHVFLEKAGFYPMGGGRVRVVIEPCARLSRLDLLERGTLVTRSARALVSSIPRRIGEREIQTIREQLGWTQQDAHTDVIESTDGPANVLVVALVSQNITEIFTGFGERGVSAERVAAGVAREARAYLAAGVPIGEHLADQLLLPMALAGGGAFRTVEPSSHTRTQSAVIREFLGIEIRMNQIADRVWEVAVGQV
ncbi:MAG: RNA 3'-terminal phosphate cyclase [Polyangiaceae bacterium]